MVAVLLALLMVEDRTYHPVALKDLAATIWTHVETCGTVALVKKEADGDIHIRLEEGTVFAVAEIVPYHPLPKPTKGQRICVQGISRKDSDHQWYEVHPVEHWHGAR